MTHSIDVSHLPSVKFDKELKNKIDYDTLKYFVKNTSDEDINNWITKFESNTELYFNNLSELPSHSRDKYCRDFYYLTYDILDKIILLRENFLNTHLFREKIKNIRDKYYTPSSGFPCNSKYKYLENEEKNLYYFCEDIDFIKEKATDIEVSNQCQSIIDEMSRRKGKLIEKKSFFERGGKITQITDKCNNKILDETFPFFECKSNDNRESSYSAGMGNEEHAGSQQLGKVVGDQLASPSGEFIKEEEASFANPEGATNNVTPINDIISVSVPILVVCVCSFLIYNFTPFGSKLQTFLKRESDIRVNQGDYPISPLLADTSNYEDMYSDNMQYNISYQNV